MCLKVNKKLIAEYDCKNWSFSYSITLMSLKVNKKLIAEYDCKNCGSFLTVLL